MLEDGCLDEDARWWWTHDYVWMIIHPWLWKYNEGCMMMAAWLCMCEHERHEYICMYIDAWLGMPDCGCMTMDVWKSMYDYGCILMAA